MPVKNNIYAEAVERIVKLETALRISQLWVSTLASVYPGHLRDGGNIENDLKTISEALEER